VKKFLEIILVIVILIILVWGAGIIISRHNASPLHQDEPGPSVQSRVAAPAPSPEASPVMEDVPTSAPLVVVADLRTSISGFVRNARNEPVSGARLRLFHGYDARFLSRPINEEAELMPAVAECSSGPDGAFVFDDLAGGLYHLEVRSPDFCDFVLKHPLSPAGGFPIANLVLTAAEPMPLPGFVSDAAGSPVSGAEVIMIGKDHFSVNFIETVKTDSTGRFEFLHAPREEQIILIARAEGYAPRHIDEIKLSPENPPGEQRIVLPTPVKFAGIVLDPAGNPLKGARVEVGFNNRESGDTLEYTKLPVFTTGDGAFSFADLPQGNAELRVMGGALHKRIVKKIVLSPERVRENQVLRLEEGRPIRGSVVDDRGTSIPGALVWWNNMQKNSVLTDAEGRFFIPETGNDPIPVEAAAPGYSFTRLAKVVQGSEGVRITLRPGSAVMGRISEAETGRPVSMARVFMKTRREAFANADGYYQTFFLTPEGKVSINAGAPGYASTKETERNIEGGIIHRNVNFELSRGASVSGRVLDRDSQAPIAGALVVPSYFQNRVKTGADGAYEVIGFQEGSQTITASAEGYEKSAPVKFTLAVNEKRTGVDILLKPASTISGIVVDSGGAPVGGARVGAYWGMMRRFGRFVPNTMVYTGQDGLFFLKGISAGEMVELGVSHPDYAEAMAGPWTLQTGQKLENIRIVLTAGGAVSGKVLSVDGRPVPGSRVAAGKGLGSFIGSGIGSIAALHEGGDFHDTREDGTYEIKHLAPGEYYVLAKAEGFVYDHREKVIVFEGKTTENVDFTLQPGVTISGLVRFESGEPVPDAQIQLMSLDFSKPQMGHTTSDQDGHFRFINLPVRTYNITVIKHPWPHVIKQGITAPDDNVEIIFGTGGTIKGFVRDSSTKKPVTRFSMKSDSSSGGLLGGAGMFDMSKFMARPRVFDDPAGAFTLEGLAEGKYKLTVTADGYAPAERAGLRVQKNTVLENIIIEMNAGVEIRGRVLDRAGKPVASAQVSIEESGTNMFGISEDMFMPDRPIDFEKTTNEEGRFIIKNLTAGLTTFKATREDYLEGKKMHFVRTDVENEEIEIILTKGGIVTGIVVAEEDNTPLGGAEVTFTGQGLVADLVPMFRRGASTGEDGGFRFEMVPPGAQTLVVSYEGRSSRKIENVNVEDDRELDLGTITLAGGGGIAGLVLDINTRPIAGALIFASGPSGMKQASTNAEGEYSLEGLSTGNWTVQLIPDQSGLMVGQAGKVQQQQALVEENKITELNFTLTPGYNLSGTVTSAGNPVSGVNVSYQNADPMIPGSEGGNTRTDTEGRYQFTEVIPGNYNLSVIRGDLNSGAALSPLHVALIAIADDTVHDVELPLGTVSGIVLDEGTGAPISGAVLFATRFADRVTIEEIIRGGRWGDVSTTTDDEGRFELREVQDGSFTLIARHDSYAYMAQSVTLAPGGQVEGLEFRLQPGLSLSGTALLLENNAPPVQLFISLTDPSGIAVHNNLVTLETNGKFTISGLRPGIYSLDAFPRNAAPLYRITCNVSAASGAPLDLRFPRGGSLALTLVNESGAPVKQARVDVVHSGGFILSLPPSIDAMMGYVSSMFTDDQGRLDRSHITPGEHELRITATGYEEYHAPVAIPDGGTVPVTVTLTQK